MATESFAPQGYEVRTLIDGATGNKTSNALQVQGARKIALYIEQANTGGSEEGEFKVNVSLDGDNFIQHNMLLDNTSDTNSESLTRVSSKTLSADGSALLFLEPKTVGALNELKVDLTVSNSDTAEFTAKVAILT